MLFCLVCVLTSGSFAAALTKAEIKHYKNEIINFQKDINRLYGKLKKTKAKQLKKQIEEKIIFEQRQISKIKTVLYSKKPKKKRRGETGVSLEAGPEEKELSPEVEKPPERKIGFKPEVGGLVGIFSGATAYLAETRLPLRVVLGPAVTSVRLASGLVQSQDPDRRFIPLDLDLIFNFPPGLLTGVENYLGAGLNYVVLTTGRTQGAVGGEVFYGVQSEGFGGVVFGEMGYAILRTGFSPSQRGISVLFGYRQLLGY